MLPALERGQGTIGSTRRDASALSLPFGFPVGRSSVIRGLGTEILPTALPHAVAIRSTVGSLHAPMDITVRCFERELSNQQGEITIEKDKTIRTNASAIQLARIFLSTSMTD
jgi:hypothetical protein